MSGGTIDIDEFENADDDEFEERNDTERIVSSSTRTTIVRGRRR